MKTVKLYIKNMVCDRCVKVVREELQKLGYGIKSIEPGKVELSGLIRLTKMNSNSV